MTTIHRTGRRPVSALACAAATVALFGLAPQAAQAGSILGSGAILTSRPCPAAADQICVVNNVPRTFTQFAGGYGGGLSTFADISAGETAQASVSFGADYLPTVGVGTTAGAATRTGATATAFRSFVYTGDVAIDLALRGDLHYVTSGDALVGDGAGEGTLNVALGLYSLADFASLSGFGPGSDGVDIVSSIVDFPDCEAGASAAGGFNSLGSTGENRATVGLATSCSGGKITLHTGDAFVVLATLQSISNRGGSLDAMHTFSVAVDAEHTYLAGTDTVVDPVLLRSAINGAVPEPGAWALMIAGFGATGAALRARRRRTLAAG